MRRLFLIAGMIALSVLGVSAQNPQASSQAAPPSAPLSIGIVVDNSGSYRLIFDRVVNATNSVIQDVRPGDEGFLVTFVSNSKIVLRQEMTGNKQELQDSAENMFIEGGATAILDAVVFGAKHFSAQAAADGTRSRVMVLITDGDERESAASIEDAIKAAKDANVRIFVLGLFEEKFYSKVVDRLCRETGGTKFVPKMPKDTASAVSSLLSAIRSK